MPTRYDSLHPLTKLTWAFVLILATYMSPVLWLSAIICLAALLTTAASAQRVSIVRVYPLFFMPIIVSLLLIRGVLLPDVVTRPITVAGYSVSLDALASAGLIILRYCTLIAALFTVIQTTPTTQLMQALAERGMPRSIEYILLMALQIIPDMRARAAAILEAQQSRGLVIKSLVSRVRALLPLVGPLVVGALVDIEERAMAL
ncbi:MAG: energy-coupling factor transporter transmembrane protein EcfT, partial [Chloroflexia bacterium]|nr:energy-coupling factor transporter transmembrane protein EcfT [Chloroflexia bacterium]